MTLRARLGWAAAAFAAVVVVAFGGLVHGAYGRQLERQLTQVLLQDLERVSALLDQPSIGASFTGAAATGVILQLVGPDGAVVLGWGDPAPLPPVSRPRRLERDGRTYLVAQGPWQAANGSVRLAHDVTEPLAVLEQVGRTLVAVGVVVVLLAALAALIAVRRMLWPLADLARQTRRLDPTTAADVTYHGRRDEVHELAVGLNGALAAIRQRHDAERAFLLEVAHELAAPLTLVHYHLDGLRRRDRDDTALQAASDAARELLRTSQDLLVVARGELERELEPQLLDLRDVVDRISAEYPGLSVEADGPAEVAGDPERLMQVVRNLVRNAVQATGAAASVRVVLLPDADAHVLQVRDAGPGMSAEAQARAFERGFTGGGGAGVGLAVAKSLVERHGGSIRVAASTAAGTVMEVRLPSLASRLETPTPEPATP